VIVCVLLLLLFMSVCVRVNGCVEWNRIVVLCCLKGVVLLLFISDIGWLLVVCLALSMCHCVF